MSKLENIISESINEAVKETIAEMDEEFDGGEDVGNAICPCKSQETQKVEKIVSEILEILRENHITVREYERIYDELHYQTKNLFTL